MKYVVCGNARVAGKTYGEQIDSADLAGANVAALIEGGHIKPAPKPADPTSSTKRDRKVAEKE